ncbi:MAG: hypothetical protein LBC67_06485 [Spirochaetales bacterium]|jgi:hypothetical protein|nr:hypothetical protein [Spirochaetales bacterium]
MKKIFGPFFRRRLKPRRRNLLEKTYVFFVLCGVLPFFAGCPASASYDFHLLEPSPAYYVASWGTDENLGLNEAFPFKTLTRAVAAVSGDAEKDRIIILDNLTSETEGLNEPSSVFVIDGTGGREITISGRGMINLDAGLEKKAVLRVAGGALVVLENITLQRSLLAGLAVEGGSSVTGRGLVIEENVLGADVSGASSFTLEDGKVVRNNNAAGPGGVHVRGGSRFVMNGAASVLYNAGRVGGVLVEEKSRFTMTRVSSVSHNRASGGGGGVYLDTSILDMGDTASIFLNAAGGGPFAGGGIALINASTLTMKGNSRIVANKALADGQVSSAAQLPVMASGGGVAMQNFCEVTLADKSFISENTADNGMAVHMKNTCSLNLSGKSAINSNEMMPPRIGLPAGGSAVWGETSCRLEMSGSSLFSSVLVNAVMSAVSLRDKCVFVMKENASILPRTKGNCVELFSCDSFTMTDNACIKEIDNCGVFMEGGGVFRMSGKAAVTGRGNDIQGCVSIGNAAEFIMNDDAGVFFNENEGFGRIVQVLGTGRFVMNGGTLSRVTPYSPTVSLAADKIGGGVCLGSAAGIPAGNPTFIMNGGVIRNNFALYGGGVAVLQGSFIKTGGVICGSNEAERNNRNLVVSGGAGAAVFVSKAASGTGLDIFMENTLPESKNLAPPYTPAGGWQD